MMDGEQDPQPDIPRLRGFLAPDGSNPFADKDPSDDDPSATQRLPYEPGDFETRIGHRGGRLLGAGILGFLLAAPTPLSEASLIYLVPLSLVFGGYAWYAGRNDLKAIGAGVMDAGGKTMTRCGHALGIIAVVLTCGTVLFHVGRFFNLIARNGLF